MGKIIVSENVTLDGVMEDPTGEEGFARGGWFGLMADKDREAWVAVEYAEALGAEALLLGRGTYEYFVARGWPSQSGDWADRLRSLPKYVVSSTLEDPKWANSTVLDGDVVDEVTKLRQNLDGAIVVYGSQRLVPILRAHDLVDGYRLTVHPFVSGDGVQLFGPTAEGQSLRLLHSRTLGEGLVHLDYEVVRPA